MESTDLNIGTGKKIKAAETEDGRLLAADEYVMAISKRLIDKNKQAYEKLAK